MVTLKIGEERYKVTFYQDNYTNQIKTVYVLAQSKDDAILQAMELTGLNILAVEPYVIGHSVP